jgi:hypothetical protein
MLYLRRGVGNLALLELQVLCFAQDDGGCLRRSVGNLASLELRSFASLRMTNRWREQAHDPPSRNL